MKAQRGELTNTRLTQKHGSGWVTIKYQNTLWNMSWTIKESLRIKNGAQYTNYKMNNSIKNEIYPKVSHNKSL